MGERAGADGPVSSSSLFLCHRSKTSACSMVISIQPSGSCDLSSVRMYGRPYQYFTYGTDGLSGNSLMTGKAIENAVSECARIEHAVCGLEPKWLRNRGPIVIVSFRIAPCEDHQDSPRPLPKTFLELPPLGPPTMAQVGVRLAVELLDGRARSRHHWVSAKTPPDTPDPRPHPIPPKTRTDGATINKCS